MKIAIDISPLTTGHYLSHRVRGTGFYLTNLKESLLKYFPDNEYYFFSRGENIPQVDIVHYPYFEPFFLTLPQVSTQKYVVTVHDLTPLVFKDQFPAGIKGKAKWLLQKRALKGASGIITDSKSSAKDIQEIVKVADSKISVVYLAAGENFKEKKDGKWEIQLSKRYQLPEKFALYVGDATWNKNLPRLIEAIKKTKIPLVMVGKVLKDEQFDKTNSWNKDLVKIFEETKNNKQFIKAGFVPDEALVSLYNRASVLVMPSLYEGFGLPILESMSCGTPVVTSKEGSIPEIAGDAACYIDVASSDSIAEGIEKVFKDKELATELSEKGLKQAKKFSWKKTAEETMEAYKKA